MYTVHLILNYTNSENGTCQLDYLSISRVERKTIVTNIFLKILYRGKFDPFVNNANLGAIAHTSNGT